jgi:hypothetical protein
MVEISMGGVDGEEGVGRINRGALTPATEALEMRSSRVRRMTVIWCLIDVDSYAHNNWIGRIAYLSKSSYSSHN